MPIDPELLLAGPRGRRLCLELAMALTENSDTQQVRDLHEAKFYAAYDLDPGRGRSRVLFGRHSEREAWPSRSPSEVAELLTAIPLPVPDERILLRAWTETVSSARYWQEPDGEDVLAATPELREPLARVAARIADSRHVGWWTEPLKSSTQWAVTFTDGPTCPRTADVAAGLQRWRAATVEDEQRARRDRPLDPRASVSGQWWSTPPIELPRSTRFLDSFGPVGLWLVEDDFGPEEARTRRLTVPENAAVYEIDGPQAWVELCHRHPLDVTAARRHDWYRITDRDGRWVVPDWTLVASEFDAVHLTALGYVTTSGRALPVMEEHSTVLAGWNPDETYWLIDIADQDPTEQAWSNEDGERGWLPTPA